MALQSFIDLTYLIMYAISKPRFVTVGLTDGLYYEHLRVSFSNPKSLECDFDNFTG